MRSTSKRVRTGSPFTRSLGSLLRDRRPTSRWCDGERRGRRRRRRMQRGRNNKRRMSPDQITGVSRWEWWGHLLGISVRKVCPTYVGWRRDFPSALPRLSFFHFSRAWTHSHTDEEHWNQTSDLPAGEHPLLPRARHRHLHFLTHLLLHRSLHKQIQPSFRQLLPLFLPTQPHLPSPTPVFDSLINAALDVQQPHHLRRSRG